MKKSMLLMGLSALSISAVAMSAHAGGSNPAAAAGLVDLSELDLIVLGDMSGGHDVEGKTFVAGNLTNAASYGGGASANPTQGYVSSSLYPTLTVGGNLSGNANINGGAIYDGTAHVTPAGVFVGGDASQASINPNVNGATIKVGGSIGNTNGGTGDTIMAGGSLLGNSHPTGAVVQSGLGTTFGNALKTTIAAEATTLSGDLQALSTALDNLTPVGGSFNFSDNNNLIITSNNNTNVGYAVIDMTAAQFEALDRSGTAKFTFDTAIPTIINVTGGTSLSFNANVGTTLGPDVLWNFVNATSITTGAFDGSILAPLATLHNTDQIDGSVAIGGRYNQGGEVHLGTFAGSAALTDAVDPTPPPPPPPPTSPAPEPAVWTTMIAGVGLVGLALRRRRAAGFAPRSA